ncbi:hypothetical protein L1987_55465 [Smallanthus sonchifolius]|uniref:Uncharacterized protein n=1 Tax=Smallanthus sonchifolius TaxID=185202 RepID=A0ACB9EAF1_9ASTR|nr:hypothetical protein L1987_55465 [Smallanthus sonchifolius]
MQYKSGIDVSSESSCRLHDKILEKRSPIEVIIPKARVEDEDFLFSMRLKVGGKPSGSSIVLSGDGTATVTRFWRNTSQLYKFDLPYDAGKVLDASILPSDDGEDGAWAVLTEKAGVWAIPEKAVLLGGVEPPERSLSRKGSSKEESTNVSFAGNIAPRRASSEAWDSGDRQRAVFTGIAHRTAQDEESEALLVQFFHEFLQSGDVNGTLNKLQNSGAFERDGETNVFARVSKSIVDTLAKHWTTTRGAEILALSVVSTQLLDTFTVTLLLRSLMHDSMGPKGGFSNFVFKQMYNNKQFSKLMRLGEEFPEELAIFLKEHPDLLWLHEIFLHQSSSASETLHSLALSDGDSSISEVVDPTSYEAKTEPTLADRRRLLNLSKIAAVAGKNADYDTKLKRIEADLRILKLQQEILKLVPEDEETQELAQKLLSPADLIQLCLNIQDKQLALYAFDVFAWTSLSFLRSNTSLLEECWKNAANQDDWETISQTTVAKGLTDEETLEALKETALYQASRRCYGPESETYEGGFEQVLLLRQESLEVSMGGSSVEGILMQHRSFPDADKLMVTAIMLGNVATDDILEDGPSPME